MLLQLAVITPSLTKPPRSTYIEDVMSVGLSDHGRHLAEQAAARLEQLLGQRVCDISFSAPAVSCTHTSTIVGRLPEDKIEYVPELSYEHSAHGKLIHRLIAQYGYAPYGQYENTAPEALAEISRAASKSLLDAIADYHCRVALAVCYPVVLQAMLMEMTHHKHAQKIRQLTLAPCEGVLMNFDEHGAVKSLYPLCIEPARV